MNLLGGFRYLRLHGAYSFATSSQFIPPFPQFTLMTKDEFATTNNFYGPQVGVRARFDWRRLFVSGAVKLALGAMVQSVDVNGSSVTSDFDNVGRTQTLSGGHFARPTNIGTHTRTAFAVVPELGLNVGYRITPWASVSVGYTFLYTNNVVRPGNQINRNISIPGVGVGGGGLLPCFAGCLPPQIEAAEPSFKFKRSDFWAQGINVGLGFRF